MISSCLSFDRSMWHAVMSDRPKMLRDSVCLFICLHVCLPVCLFLTLYSCVLVNHFLVSLSFLNSIAPSSVTDVVYHPVLFLFAPFSTSHSTLFSSSSSYTDQ